MEFKDDGLINILTKEQLAQMTDKQIEEMATVYSEGNAGLKELLIYCAKNQIPTFASCGGHPDEKDNDPYIGFILDDSTTELFSRVFEEILKSERNISMDKFDTINRLGIHVNKENPESLANVKDFCKKVSYRQMGLNMLNSFITKIKNFGKTKDNERSKPWTR